jgi:hypothetical protein
VYKDKIKEIEILKKKKEEIIASYRKSEEDADKNTIMLQNYLENLEKKKRDFDKFMTEKGKEALEHVKRTKELDKKLKEELYKVEHKKQIKEEEIMKSHQLAQYYRELQQRKNEIEEFEEPDFYYKVSQAFHNMGNKIDFSTTRFHNITVIRHEEEFKDYITAQEKAIKEAENTISRETEKSQNLKKFNSETKVNSLEIMKKMKTKENLKKLEDELYKLKEARKKSKSKNHMTGQNPIGPKFNERKSEELMKKLMNDKKANRKNVYSAKDIEVKKTNNIGIFLLHRTC